MTRFRPTFSTLLVLFAASFVVPSSASAEDGSGRVLLKERSERGNALADTFERAWRGYKVLDAGAEANYTVVATTRVCTFSAATCELSCVATYGTQSRPRSSITIQVGQVTANRLRMTYAGTRRYANRRTRRFDLDPKADSVTRPSIVLSRAARAAASFRVEIRSEFEPNDDCAGADCGVWSNDTYAANALLMFQDATRRDRAESLMDELHGMCGERPE